MGNERKHLIERFAEASLKLVVAKAPINKVGNDDVFQLDIPRKLQGNTRIEWFRIWPGHESNQIVVQNIDKNLKQLVLMVREDERTFNTEEHVSTKQWESMRPKLYIGIHYMGGKVVAITKRDGNKFHRGYSVTVEHKTPVSKRHYLCGVDERQLFICQLPRGCSTVADAHQALKRTELITAEGKAPGKTIRQGEWFFVHPTYAEQESLNKLLAERPYLIHKKEAIGSGGHPHTADEIIRIPGKLLKHGWAIRENDIYVKGTVHHVDHAPVRFATWRRVIRNNEWGSNWPARGGAFEGRGGVFWID